MEFDCAPLVLGQAQQEAFGKLKAQPALAQARVDEKILKARRPHNFPLLLQIASGLVSDFGYAPLLRGLNAGIKRGNSRSQHRIIGGGGKNRILFSRLRPRGEENDSEK